MQIRCPHCHNPIEVLADDPLMEVECTSCGSRFSFLGAQETSSWHGTKTRTIAHFELIEQVGAGHFGSVWKAHDTQLDRTVAVKIPRREQLDSLHLEQFLREARAAAQLRHSNIVPVHEVGQLDGTVYIVSDFIAGCSLKEALSGQRFTQREAAELCATIAEALHHAHESGVIHRDLKPGNVMLDIDHQPHLMDFGLARRETGEITVTVDGRIIGTPAYMSPEQAKGEAHYADRRSDVYSLGVVLFEMLTGELPFRGEARMLVVQIIKDEPPSPRRLNGHVSRDLNTICLKCLQKSPDRRYQNAVELADDLRRWLDGRPILARPVGRIERLARWGRRQPAIASLAITVLIVTLAGFGGITWQWRKAVAASTLAQKNLEESEKQRTRRELNFARAMSAVDKMLTQVGESRLAGVPNVGPVRKAILEDALKLYEELLKENESDSSVRAEMGQASMRVGQIYDLLDDDDRALVFYQRAIEVLSGLGKGDPEKNDIVVRLAECYGLAGRLLEAESRFAEAVESHGKGVTLLRSRAARPEALVTRLLMSGLWGYGNSLFEAGRRTDGIAALREAAEIAERLSPTDVAWRPFLSATYERLAKFTKIAGGDYPEEERFIRRSVGLSEDMYKAEGTRGRIQYVSPLESSDAREITSYGAALAQRYQLLAAFLRRKDRQDEAKALEEKALKVQSSSIGELEERVAKNLMRVFDRQTLGQDYVSQARILKQQERTSEAEESYRKALDVYRQLAADSPSTSFYRRSIIDIALELLPLFATDEERWQAEIAVVEDMRQQMRQLGDSNAEDARIDDGLYQAIVASVNAPMPASVVPAKARALRERQLLAALKVAQRRFDRDPNRIPAQEGLIWSHGRLGDFLLASKPGEAASHYQLELPIRERVIASQGIRQGTAANLGWICTNLTNALLATQPTPEVFPLAMRALEMREYLEKERSNEALNHKELEVSYALIAQVLAHQREIGDSDVQKAAEAANERTGKDSSMGMAWRALGIALYRKQQFELAAEALRKANGMSLAQPAYDRLFLAMSVARLGQREEAEKLLAEGIALIRDISPSDADKLLRSLREEAVQTVRET